MTTNIIIKCKMFQGLGFQAKWAKYFSIKVSKWNRKLKRCKQKPVNIKTTFKVNHLNCTTMNLRRVYLVSPFSLPLKMQKYKGAVYNERHVSVNVWDVEVFTWFTITVGHVGHVSHRCWMTWPHVTPVELSWMLSELQMAILQSGITK